MGRTNPIAVVYLLRNVITGKVYVGETANFVDRMSSYRTTARGRNNPESQRPIDIAVREYGFDAFTVEILISQDDEPNLVDTAYRRIREAVMIKKYKATNPKYGYNTKDDNRAKRMRHKPSGHKHKTSTKILKSDPVIVYDRNDGTVMLYLGAKSCASILGISDKSIVTSAVKKGKTINGRTFFKADYDQRLYLATKIIREKTEDVDRPGANATRKKSLRLYIEGLQAISDFCDEWGFTALDLDKLLKS